MKSILIINNRLPVEQEGADIRAFKMIEGLSKTHKVFLLCLRNSRKAENISDLNKKCEVIIAPSFIEDFLKEGYANFVKIIFVKIFLQISEWFIFSSSPAMIRKIRAQVYFLRRCLKKMLKDNKFDFVQAEDSFLGDVLKNIEANSVKIMDFVHVNYIREKNPRQSRKNYLYEEKLSSIYNIALVCSSLDGERINKFGYKKIMLVPNGVDAEYFKPTASKAGEKNLVFLGNLKYPPNKEAVSYLLENIYPQLPAGIKINIIGNYGKKDFIKQKKLKNVFFRGFVKDIREYLRGAILLCPIFTGGGTRLKILTALACGCPVVSSVKGAEGIDYVDGENILIADSPESFREKIEILLNNPGIYEKISENSRKLSLKYDWKNIMDNYSKELERADSTA